jgi:flagellar motor switch protein FliN/FliY
MQPSREFLRSTRKNLDMDQMSDVSLPLKMVLGHKMLTIRELLNLKEASVVELNRLAGENIDLYINERIMAKGEVVVMNGHFGFRLVTLLNPSERLKQM